MSACVVLLRLCECACASMHEFVSVSLFVCVYVLNLCLIVCV